MKKNYRGLLYIGLLWVFFGIMLQIFYRDPGITWGLVGGGIGLIAGALYGHIRYKEIPEFDERLLKIYRVAYSKSYAVIFILIALLFLLDLFNLLKLNTSHALGLIVILMVIVPIISNQYYKWKGDTE